MKKFFFTLLSMAVLLSCGGGGSSNGDGGNGGSYEIHEFVDLALPSGTKWATSNVGAAKPEEIGGYYAWGEVAAKQSYNLDNYKWWDGNKLTKYCTDSEMGIVDNKMILDCDDDAVRYNCGGNWRMPTRDDFQELKDNCFWEWVVVDSVSGYKVTGSNGNSVFLPAGGAFVGSEKLDEEFGYYWSASLDDVNYGDAYAYCIGLDSCNFDFKCLERSIGLLMRPVSNEKAKGSKVVGKHRVTVSAKGNGSVLIVGETGKTAKVAGGEKITVIANADEGSEFVGWSVVGSNDVISNKNLYTFAVVMDIHLVATFEEPETKEKEYNVAVFAEGDGSVSIAGESGTTVKVVEGKKVTVVANANEGAELVGWSEAGSSRVVSASSSYTFTVDKNSYLVATFKESDTVDSIMVKKTVMVSAEGNGSVCIVGESDTTAQIVVGGKVTVIANADEDAEFVGWYVKNSDRLVSEAAIFTFILDKGIHLVAKFKEPETKKVEYNVAVFAIGGGFVSITGETGTRTKVAEGEEITVVANAYEGSKFVGWSEAGSGRVVSAATSCTFTVDKNSYLVAEFEEVETEYSEYNITLYCKGKGSVSIEGGNYFESEDNSRVTEVLEKGREIAAVISPAEGSEFVGWFREGSNEPVSEDMMYIFTVTEDVVLMALCVDSETDNDKPVVKKSVVTDKRAVDLGLSVYWASCNIGASRPEENGTLFAWAEIEEKSAYGWSNYKYCENGDRYSITKYSPKVDGKSLIEPEDDAAHVKWGGSWRMPTSKEVRELFTKCKWKWTEVNGIPGYMVTGRNGNSIFLPVTSSGYGDKISSQIEYENGGYWINGCSSGNPDIAMLMYISKRGQIIDFYHRHYGEAIRAVCE